MARIGRIKAQIPGDEGLEYFQLVQRILEDGRKLLTPDQPDPPTLRNTLSALASWMKFHSRKEGSRIGAELTVDNAAWSPTPREKIEARYPDPSETGVVISCWKIGSEVLPDPN